MKKKLVVLLMVAAIAVGACACKNNSDSKNETTENWEDVPLYGCPYSKRIKKLNLLKRKIRK